MVDGLNVFRPATEVERTNFIDISHGYHSILDKFLARLADKILEYQKKFQPFDAFGARMDFEEDVKRFVSQTTIAIKGGKIDQLKDINFNEYAKAKRFELISVEPVKEDKLLDGIRNSVLTGYNYVFKAIQRGNGITINVPHSTDKRLNMIPVIEHWLNENGFVIPNILDITKHIILEKEPVDGIKTEKEEIKVEDIQ